MKLRYLFLPRSGPLTGIAVKFGSEISENSAAAIRSERRGAINFVVGVNGSGKSTILRAVFQTFRGLSNGFSPAQPITLAWDWPTPEGLVTVIVSYAPDDTSIEESSWFAVIDEVHPQTNAAGWAAIIARKGIGENGEKQKRFGELERYSGSSDFSAYLPRPIVAYTSGDPSPWIGLYGFGKPVQFEDDPDATTALERPPAWSLQKEWNAEIERILAEMVEENESKSDKFAVSASGFGVLQELKKTIVTNNLLKGERHRDNILFIGPSELRSAAVALALSQAAKEFAGLTADWEIETARTRFLDDARKSSAGDARSVLSQIDWFAPTHLVLDYKDDGESLLPVQREQLLALLALSDRVIRQPDGSNRVTIPLGAFQGAELDEESRLAFSKKIESVFPTETYNVTFEALVRRLSEAKTGAEAILRTLSSNDSIESMLFEVFKTLLAWQESSVIKSLDLTVKRLNRYTSFDGEKDFSIVLLDQLSDGERMLLCRMALLYLLKGQDGALLLLDEPETHLNDRWKRELVNWVENAVLKDTAAQVIVSTHTSIVLTDALASEISVLRKTDEGVEVKAVTGGTYGTDPGEIMTRIYESDSSTGSSSLEHLEHLLTINWTVEQIPVLEQILTKLGSSFHRAELRAKLEDLKRSLHGSL